MNPKEKLLDEAFGILQKNSEYKYLCLAIRLPSGAVELISNSLQIKEKLEYISNAYDENLILKANSSIRIENYMVG